MKKWWDWVVFLAALLVATSLVIDLTYEMAESEKLLMEEVDLIVLAVFAVDLVKEYRNFKGSGLRFTREHWLDIVAIMPFFRIVRIAKFARVEELAKLEEIVEVRKGINAEETVSKTIHDRHLKKKGED